MTWCCRVLWRAKRGAMVGFSPEKMLIVVVHTDALVATKRWLASRLLALVGGSFVLFGCSAGSGERYTLLQGATMGTYYRIQSACPAAPTAAAIEAQLQAFNLVFSTYEAGSELSRLNDNSTTDWVSISADLFGVLSAAAELAGTSAGGFDPTVGALVELWGFGVAEPEREPPTPAAIESARVNTGLDVMQLRQGPSASPQVRLLQSRRIDLSALAKGRAVDELADRLVAQGCTDLLVDIGGEIRVLGRSPKERPWRLAVEQPGELAPGNEALPVLQLTAGAVATSGDYRNFRELSGERYSHLIDPRTGYPVTHGLASVTVWHPQAMWADGFATLVSVVGPEEGQALAEQAKLAVAMLIRTTQGFASWQSSEFRRRFGHAAKATQRTSYSQDSRR